MPKEDLYNVELAGVVLPANVMLPSGSSTITLGNHMSYAEGAQPGHTRIGGMVRRISFAPETAAVRVDIVDPDGKNSGQAYVTSTGMVCYVRTPPAKEEKK